MPVLAVNNINNTGIAPDEPLKTITTGGHHILATPYMTAIGQTGFSEDRSYVPCTGHAADTEGMKKAPALRQEPRL